jgi:alkylhydroperoxidase/carboxymuconolactone decarboxylase family protein YurZ
LKHQSKRRADELVAFRRPLESIKLANPESRKIYDEIERQLGRIPEIYQVKALADNPQWLRVLHDSVFRWPQGCTLDEKTKELVGLGKSIGRQWEPGVLTNIEGAIDAGATPEEIAETILLASTVVGLADLNYAFRAAHFEMIGDDSIRKIADVSVQRVFDDAVATMGSVPELYRFKNMTENSDWLQAVHKSARILYTDGILRRKAKALVCLGTSAAKHWDRGVEEYLEFATKSGATRREIADVLCSIYKTAVSIGVQTGFSVPCSIPEMSGLRLLQDYYSKAGSSRRIADHG